jgi:hypothetical protein
MSGDSGFARPGVGAQGVRALAVACLALAGGCAEESRQPDRVAASAPAREAPKPGFAEQAAVAARYDAHVGALATKLRRGRFRGFSDLWIEHEPAYAVIIAFKTPPERPAVLALAHPDIRPLIEFRTAKRDRREIGRDMDRANAAFRGSPVEWVGRYDVKTGRFTYDFANEAGAAWARERLPGDLREDFTIRTGPIPQPLGNRPVGGRSVTASPGVSGSGS